MTSIELLASARRRDWTGLPWLLMGAGVAACLLAAILTWSLATEPAAGRLWLLTGGLLCAGIALAIRLNSTTTVLDRFVGPSRGLLLLALAVLFLLLAAGAVTVFVLSFYDWPWVPLHTGQAVCLCIVVVPLGVTAAFRAMRIASQARAISGADESALLLFFAALCCFLAGQALELSADPLSWDTMRMALRVFMVVALIASALVLASVRVRRWTISVLILLHFTAIGSATLSPAPSPWVVQQAWTRLFRPYLEFMYLNNAYHFYAPEPGPPTYFWCRLIYANDEGKQSGVWFKVPKLDEQTGQQLHTVALEYQRHLAMVENVTFAEAVSLYDGNGNPTPTFQRRQYASSGIQVVGFPASKLVVPFHPHIPINQQYARPADSARRLIASYVRHVAKVNAEPPPELDGYHLKWIKVYRVRHDIPSSDLYAKSDPPVAANHPGLFRPFYMGLYDPDGELQDGRYRDGRLIAAEDPFLYWMLPVLLKENTLVTYDYCRLHAGDPNWIRLPDSGEWVDQEHAQHFIDRDKIIAPPKEPNQAGRP